MTAEYVDYTTGEPVVDTKAPAGPVNERWDKRRFEAKLVNPANRRKHTVIVVGTGLAGGSMRRHPRRTGLPRRPVLLPGLPAPRPLHRRTGRHQRGEELPQRRGLGPPSVLRHGEGRRLQGARVERPPARADLRRDHRPVRGAGRAVRAGVRRSARHPLLRRRPGVADLLRPRADRSAAAPRRLSGPVPADRRREHRDAPADRDARPDRHRREGARDRGPGSHHRARRHLLRGRRRPGERRLRQRLLPVDERHELQRHRRLAGAPARCLLRQPLLHTDPPHVHPAHRRAPVQTDADERVAAQRRPDLGAEGQGRRPASEQDPRGRARLLPGAHLPVLRQPGPA